MFNTITELKEEILRKNYNFFFSQKMVKSQKTEDKWNDLTIDDLSDDPIELFSFYFQTVEIFDEDNKKHQKLLNEFDECNCKNEILSLYQDISKIDFPDKFYDLIFTSCENYENWLKGFIVWELEPMIETCS